MTNSKKTNQDKPTKKRQQVTAAPDEGFTLGQENAAELAEQAAQSPWAKLTVKPDLSAMFASQITNPPEAGIGKRIAYCRGQLDNLSVEALARYTKYFDADGNGVSRMSIVRYEDGAVPCGREIRILCEALWVPADWLVFGRLETTGVSAEDVALLDALNAWKAKGTTRGELSNMTKGMDTRAKQNEIEQRQKWLHEARKAKPKE
jgi:hypothetical protein